METFGRAVAGPLSGYLFNAWGARGIPLSCAGAAAYVAVALCVRGLAETSAVCDVGQGNVNGRSNADELKRK